MGKISVVLLGLASLLAYCLAEKDPILLRPPHHSSQSSVSSPVFSASIDSIPTVSSSSTNQQSVYAKNPGFSHASASAAASASSSDQITSGGGGRNPPWYTSGSGFSFDYNSGSGSANPDASSSSASHASVATPGGGYYADHPPQQGTHLTPTAPLDGYAPGTPGGNPHGPQYTYYYQHYPGNSNQGWVGGDEPNHGGFLGDFGLPGLGVGGGIAGAKAIKVIAVAIAKGILTIKPFLIIGLLLLIAVPVLLLLLPIPIITITGQPAVLRSARSSPITSYITELSGKVLNAEECLERIICKLPQAPEKYQSKAKIIWNEYGSKLVTNSRVARGVNAYFETASQKNKNLKCDQRFKCSNKYL